MRCCNPYIRIAKNVIEIGLAKARRLEDGRGYKERGWRVLLDRFYFVGENHVA